MNILYTLQHNNNFFLFFRLGEIENAFTHVVWISAEVITTKLKTPLLSHQPMTLEPS